MTLMDTCAIVWGALEPSILTPQAVDAIDKADRNHTLMISDISIWEISMLIKKRKIEVDTSASNLINLFLQSRNIKVQSITPEIAELSVNLGPQINKDLADRLIAATAIVYNANLVTADQNLIDSGLLSIIWR